jgi:hypothetical protein
MAIGACVLWGFLLLSGLSYLLAEAQGARPLSESRCTPTVSLVVMPISMGYSSGLVDALFITAMAQPVCQTGAASAVAA